MILDALPAEARPLVQVVPDWFHPQRLGLIFEARVGRGKLVVCSIDLRNDLPSRPAARQMLHALLKYLDSDDFSPQNRLDVSAIHALFREPTLLQRLGAKVWADSQQVGHEAALAVDGNPDTIWHTQWEPDSPAPPHWIALDLQKPVQLSGIRYLPRGDMSNGRIAAFEVQLSGDGETWNVAAAGSWSDDAGEKVVRLDQPRMTRYVRLVGRREVRGRAWSSIAELDIIVADDE